jgi:hypothetical protein
LKRVHRSQLVPFRALMQCTHTGLELHLLCHFVTAGVQKSTRKVLEGQRAVDEFASRQRDSGGRSQIMIAACVPSMDRCAISHCGVWLAHHI